MTIYLIRHATPDRNTGMDYHKWPGPPLNWQGEQEASNLAGTLARCNIQRLYSSPFARATGTANIIGDALRISPQLESGLGEWQHDDTEEKVAARVQKVLSGLPRGNVVIVSHGWVIRTALKLYGMSADTLAQYTSRYDTENPLPCAGVWRVTPRWWRKPEMVLL